MEPVIAHRPVGATASPGDAEAETLPAMDSDVAHRFAGAADAGRQAGEDAEDGDGEYEEDDEYHPDINSILDHEVVYLHQWHRRLFEISACRRPSKDLPTCLKKRMTKYLIDTMI